MVRKANESDIERIICLLHQVNMVHYAIRPDLFRPHTTKYDEQELCSMLSDSSKPIFVYDDGTNTVQGYALCQLSEVKGDKLLQDVKTLYVDDICVDEQARCKHVGKALYEHVRDYARSIGCHNVTLNVWNGNEPAISFYKNMGMQVQKTTMEIIFTLIALLIPIFVAGIIAKSEKHAFRQNDGTKHVLLTDFKTGIDDYTQFFGPAMTVGLKLGGVEGRSDWGRLKKNRNTFILGGSFVVSF